MDRKILLKNVFVTFLYALFTLVIVLHHEIWADEAQVWLICKNLNIFELFKHLVNEGHPAFFYLLIMPFAKILHGTNAIFSMQLICWLSSTIAVFLLWHFSPFNKRTKAAITLSAGFLYFMPVIARSYSLIPLFVFLLAIFYPKRHERPIIYGILTALCANIHVIMFGFSSMLAMLFVYESFNSEKQADNPSNSNLISKVFSRLKSLSKGKKAGMAIMLLGLLAVVLQLHGTTSSNVFIKYDFTNLFGSIFSVVSQFFINFYDGLFPYTGNILFQQIGIGLILLSVLIYILLWAVLFLNDKKLFFISFVGIFFQFLIYVIAYHTWIFVTRIFSMHLILLFCFWVMLARKDFKPKFKITGKKAINILVAFFFLISTINGLKFCVLDIFNNYSGAKETAQFIKNNIISENSFLITDNPPYCISLIYYLDGEHEIFSASRNEFIKYITWDKNLYSYLSSKGWNRYIDSMFEAGSEYTTKKIYVIVSTYQKYRFNVDKLENFKKIFESKPTVIMYEGYIIYEYTGKQPDSNRRQKKP